MDTMEEEKYTTVKLFEFSKVSLFKASDTPGKKWNTYGDKGRVDVKMITESDPKLPNREGWSQLTFYNQGTCALGMNIMFVPNLVFLLSRNEPGRITFKALSRNIGCNGMKSMYSLRLASKVDAEKLCYLCELLQTGATEAREGRPVTLKENTEDPTAAQVFFASENEALINCIKSKLLQLAETRAKQGLRITLKYVEDIRAAAEIGRDNDGANHNDINNKQPLGVVAEEKEVVVPFESIIGKHRNAKIGDDPSNDRSIESDTDSPVWAESQDWEAAFK
jgi:hypothetical protein